VDSTHHDRPAGVFERLQVSEDFVRRCSAKTRDVLNDNPRRSCLLDDSCELRPEVPCIVASPATAGDRVRLAGKATCDKLNSSPVLGAVEGVDVVMDRHSGKVLRQHAARVVLDLAEGDRLPPHPPRGQGEAADA
jgi:hypothetical protein